MDDRLEEINQMNLPFLNNMEIVGNVRILRLQGRFDQETLPGILKIRDRLVQGREINTLNLLFDFEKVTDVDSSALAVLSIRLEELKEHKHRLGLINIPEKMRGLMDIFKESSAVELFVSEKEALEALND